MEKIIKLYGKTLKEAYLIEERKLTDRETQYLNAYSPY